MLKLICFDLDNTLWSMDGIISAAETALITFLTEKAGLTQITPEQLQAHKLDYAQQYPEIAHNPTALRTASLENFLLQQKIPAEEITEIARQGFAEFLNIRNQVQPFPSVQNTLEALKETYQLASITNGNACLKRIGLSHFFDIQLSPVEAGTKKPDPRIFEQALEQTKISPHSALHIGDHWQDDMLGAKKIGLKTLWINRYQHKWPGPDEYCPDGIITHIDELLDKLPQLLADHF